MENYAEENETLSEAIEKYLKTACGVSDLHLEKIREIFIED